VPTSVGFDASNGVATLVLNRPDRLNALTSVMTAEILDALKTCARDDGIRCLVITGAGRGFWAGQDLEELQSVQGPSAVGDHLRHGFNQVVLGLRQLDKPVLGAINGVAAGAGLGIALAADLRIASDKARLSVAFNGIGLAPDTGVSWFLHLSTKPRCRTSPSVRPTIARVSPPSWRSDLPTFRGSRTPRRRRIHESYLFSLQ